MAHRWFWTLAAIMAAVLFLAGCSVDEGDIESPGIDLNPVTTPTVESTVALSGTVEEGAEVEISVDTAAEAEDIQVSGEAWSATLVGLEEGNNTVTVIATDAAGNLRSLFFTIVLDTVAPEVTIEQFLTPTAGTSQTVGGIVEGGATVEVSLDGLPLDDALVNGTVWTTDVSGLQAGENTLSVVAVDEAGNASESVEETITVDSAAPALTVDGLETPTRDTAQTISGTREAGADILVEIDPGADVGDVDLETSPETWQVALSGLSPGNNVVTVTVDVDGAPETEEDAATARLILTVDKTAPIVLETSPENGDEEVAADSLITATFSELLDETTLSDTTFLLTDSAGETVAGDLAFDPVEKLLTFTPSAPLAQETRFTVTIKTGATDLAGNSLTGDVTWAFDTL